MPYDPHLAAIRFGTGLSPLIDPPVWDGDLIEHLRQPDLAARDWRIAPYSSLLPNVVDYFATVRLSNKGTPAERTEAGERLRGLRRERLDAAKTDFRTSLARMVTSPDGLRERLVLFWADHFTVVAQGNEADWGPYILPYIEEAIRPHVMGRFKDMLLAVITHPVMVHYLDQDRSMGPESVAGLNRNSGLNENLARELLELHTLGVGGPYNQTDVRELAELLTGLTINDGVSIFRPQWAEPGPEMVLGRVYPQNGRMRPIENVLNDLAAHPVTADHIARKLAVHFVADQPNPGLVATLSATFVRTAGDLGAVMEDLIAHPASWAPRKRKIRRPIEFLVASLRAMGVSGEWIVERDPKETDELFLNPLAAMGQPWNRAPGPDGWAEASEAWVTPQGVAARIDWSMTRPQRLVDMLPDPREFVVTALGPGVSEAAAFAARAAERPNEGIGLVLASAEFQRR